MRIRRFPIESKRINILANILLFIIIPFYFVTEEGVFFALILLWATWHETAHMLFAAILKCDIGRISINPFGLHAEINISKPGRKKRVCILLAGVLANLIIAFVFYIFYNNLNFNGDFVYLSFYINIYLVIFNLLPVMPLDGGRLVYELTAELFGYRSAEKAIGIISIFTGILVFIIGMYIFLADMRNYGLLLVGAYLLLLQWYSKFQTKFDRIKNLLYKRERMMDKDVYETRVITLNYNLRPGEIIKYMDYDKFHMIFVVDNDMELITCLTEQNIHNFNEMGLDRISLKRILKRE